MEVDMESTGQGKEATDIALRDLRAAEAELKKGGSDLCAAAS
jgi:hypothetical protein